MPIITIFVIVLLAVFATIAYFTEPSEADKRRRERLGEVMWGCGETEGVGDEILRQVAFSRIPAVDRLLRSKKFALKLLLMLDRAQLSWTVGRFFFFSLCMLLVGAIIGSWWMPLSFGGWLLGLALGFAPFAWVVYKGSVRLNRFVLQLPDAIDLIARSLRAGYALPSALVAVAEEMADPLGTEFRRAAEI